MKQEAPFRILESSFSFLQQDYGFVLALRQDSDVYGSGKIEFHSQKCWVTIGLDRSSVYVLLAPAERVQDCWIDLGTIVSYLTDGRVDDVYEAYGVRWRRQLPYLERISEEASQLAPALRDYLPAIYDLFANSPPEQVCSALRHYLIVRAERRAGLT